MLGETGPHQDDIVFADLAGAAGQLQPDLLPRGVPDLSSDGQLPLHLAAAAGHAESSCSC